MNHLHERIKYIRKTEGLTQKDFAKRLLISQSYLSGLETGNEVPANKLIKLICLEFGIREKWLSDGKGEMYDTVFENDKSLLVETSNEALFKIMKLLTTKSNVEYGYYANILERFANILTQIASVNIEENRLETLEHLQNVIINLDRTFDLTYHIYKDPRTEYNVFGATSNAKATMEELEGLLAYIKNTPSIR